MKSILFFEIQVLFTDGFPHASKKFDQINRIHCKFVNENQETNYLITTFSVTNISSALDITHLRYSTELELIFGFGNLIKQLNPQVIIGYNIHQFDFNYIRDRLLHWNDNEYSEQNFTESFDLTWIEEQGQSSALGSQTIKYYQYSNSKPIDLFQEARKKHRLMSYKLSNVLVDLFDMKVINTNSNETNCIFSSDSDFAQQEKIIKEELALMNGLKLIYFNG